MSEVVKYTNVAFETDESVLFREVSLIQGVLIERFHCIRTYEVFVFNSEHCMGMNLEWRVLEVEF